MFRRDAVSFTFSEFARESGLSKKSKSWYRRSNETIVVLTLTRAPYGRQYFLAVGVTLRTLDADEHPKDRHAQVRTRFDRLVPASVEHHLNDLFDTEFPIPAADRRDELLAVLRSQLLPVFELGASLDGLRSSAGREFRRASTVSTDARDVLAIRE